MAERCKSNNNYYGESFNKKNSKYKDHKKFNRNYQTGDEFFVSDKKYDRSQHYFQEDFVEYQRNKKYFSNDGNGNSTKTSKWKNNNCYRKFNEFRHDRSSCANHSWQKKHKHPPHLRGKDIGLFYASRQKEKSKANEIKHRPKVEMNPNQMQNAEDILHRIKIKKQFENMPAEPAQEYNFSQLHEKLKSNPHDCFTQENNYVSSAEFYKNLERKEKIKLKNLKYCETLECRKKLPSYSMKAELLSLISSNQVVLITGETGCGKTTQVPQYILDNEISKGNGHNCKIVCTQPRRISAISVAERVAFERGEECGGNNSSCGYQIRLQMRLPRSQGSIMYCTTGVILQQLKSNPLLNDLSHIILDEVHERDLNSDFLLAVVKDIIIKRSDIKVILMSATMNSKIFKQFFNDCPLLHIPGFTYSVERFYLEDIVKLLNYQAPSPVLKVLDKYGGYKCNLTFKKKLFVEQQNKRMDNLNEYLDSNKCTSTFSNCEKLTISAVSEYIETNVEYDLIMALLKHIITFQKSGAVLVFLQGWSEISTLSNMIKRDKYFTPSKFKVIPLHSMIPIMSQKDVFNNPPSGVTKIVIATSIAETSITINDIVHVIDCGKIKTTTFDTKNDLAMLQSSWISKANGLQRCGRAGRVKEGFCYHLYTKLKENNLNDYILAEIHRTPLDSLCLQVRNLQLGLVEEFLPKVLEPPTSEAISFALEKLFYLNAIDEFQNLTPLGRHLAQLPVEPQIGKMILMGAIFGCVNPILTVASYLSFKDPFHVPMGKEKEVDERRRMFVTNINSDHLTVLNVFDAWERAQTLGSGSSFCYENFLSISTLKMLKDCKIQFAQHLKDIGFLKTTNPKEVQSNKFSKNLKIVNAIVCSGLYPNVLKVLPKNNMSQVPTLKDKSGKKIKLHAKSVNSNLKSFEYDHKWLCFYEKIKTNSTYVFDSCIVSPYPLLFFGGKISTHKENHMHMIAVDDWIVFKADPKIAHLVKQLRRQLDVILENKIENPNTNSWHGKDTYEEVLTSILQLITSE